MCDSEGCDGDEVPPGLERWCRRRLDVELERWLTGWPMAAGRPVPAESLLRKPATGT